MNADENPFRAPEVADPPAMEAPDLGASAEVVEVLKLTRPWVLFLAIVSLVLVAFIVLGSVVVLLAALGQRTFGLILVLTYSFLAILYAISCLFLLKYASRITRLAQAPSEETLVDAINAQTSFWRFVGIILITILAFMLLVVVRSM